MQQHGIAFEQRGAIPDAAKTWKAKKSVERARLEWVVWVNPNPLMEPLGCLQLAEIEVSYDLHRVG